MTDVHLICALQRQSLFHFVHRVFLELNPGGEFIPNWHVRAICIALEDVYSGRTKRLLITVPPRHLKSICGTIAFPAWVFGRAPETRIMVASHSQALTNEHSRHFRQVIEAHWYRRLYSQMRINPRVDRSDEVATTKGGTRVAVSRGSSATGRGADILIVDDLNRASDAVSATDRETASTFFRETLVSRLNDKETGAIIVLQQRVHEDDIPGILINQGGYRHIDLPAIAREAGTFDLGFGEVHHRSVGDLLMPQREPRETLENIRSEMGPAAFNAQYLQDPVLPGANAVRWEWFGQYDVAPERTRFQYIVQSWDTGFSAAPNSDFSVCLTFGYFDNNWYLLDMYRRQRDFPDLVSDARHLISRWVPDRVLIENAASGKPLFQELRSQSKRMEIFALSTPKDTKEERLRAQTQRLSEGLIKVPAEAHWLASFRQELLGFPNARNDDVVDALTQALKFMGSPRGQNLNARDPRTGRRQLSRRGSISRR
nr:phage terminase large subunit [uncultured Hyphomonas sp.]